MAQLNSQQQDIIYDLLVDNDVSFEALKIDLLDHICCMVEEKMERGLDFRQALTLSTQEFGLSNLTELQEATFHLLNLKINKMKKVIGITGIISAIFIISGVGFKLNHWPLAGVLLLSGLLLMSLIVLPAIAYFEARNLSGSWQKLRVVSGYLSAMFFSVATLFKIMYWPSTIFYSIFWFFLLVVFLPLFSIRNYKTAENKIMACAKILLIIAGVVVFFGLLSINDKSLII